eukprot:6174652-Pleurochrysis_carterae.AAC.1
MCSSGASPARVNAHRHDGCCARNRVATLMGLLRMRTGKTVADLRLGARVCPRHDLIARTMPRLADLRLGDARCVACTRARGLCAPSVRRPAALAHEAEEVVGEVAGQRVVAPHAARARAVLRRHKAPRAMRDGAAAVDSHGES